LRLKINQKKLTEVAEDDNEGSSEWHKTKLQSKLGSQKSQKSFFITDLRSSQLHYRRDKKTPEPYLPTRKHYSMEEELSERISFKSKS